MINLDVQDILGDHSENLQGSIKKTRTTKDGVAVNTENINDIQKLQSKGQTDDSHDFDVIKKQFEEGWGCNIAGTFLVNKVKSN